MKLKKGSIEAKNFMAKIRAKKGKPKKVSGVKKPSVKKTPTKKHTDINSHNYKISISGEISKGRKKLIENLSFLYGKFASEYLFAKNQKEKKRIYKEMQILRKELNNLTIDKYGFYKTK